MILCGAPVPGKQFVETVLGDVGDARENIGELGRIDIQRIQMMAAARNRKPRKWIVRRS